MLLKFKKRVREISLKYSSLSGHISSKKLNKPVQFESSLERDFIYLLEFDFNVKMYLEQPLEIPYKDENGINRVYIPDFAVSYHDKFRKNEIIEIKYESELLLKNPNLILKHEAARKYCIANNLMFRICTDVDIRETNNIKLKNIKFLSSYRDYFDNINYKATGLEFNATYDIFLTKIIRKEKEISIQKLINKVSTDYQKQAELIFIIWYLIANNFISCNLNKPLNMNSTVWID